MLRRALFPLDLHAAGRLLELVLRLERLHSALQEQIRSLATRQLALRTGIFCHYNPLSLKLRQTLDATFLRRTKGVMGDRSDVFNVGDLEPAPVQRTHGGFAARAGTHHPHLDVLHAMLLGRRARAFRGNLGRERRRFARTAETATTPGPPRHLIALPLADGDAAV